MNSDLIKFLEMWYSNNNNLVVSSGRLDVAIEREFGSYRLNQLMEPLKALKVCTLCKGRNYWLFSNISNGYNSSDVKHLIADVKKGLYSSKAPSDFAQDQKEFHNKLWSATPKWLRTVVLLVIALSFIWGSIKFIPDAVEWVRIAFAKQNETHFVAQQVWTETHSNLKTLNRFLEEKEKFAFRKKSVHFVYDAYNKYNGQLGEQTSRQVDNFFKNLKRIENGEPYSRDEILKIKGQGVDVLNFLRRDFGLRDYFEGNQAIHIASAYGSSTLRTSKTLNNIVSADTVIVSAELPELTSPPYGSIGEGSAKGRDGKSN